MLFYENRDVKEVNTLVNKVDDLVSVRVPVSHIKASVVDHIISDGSVDEISDGLVGIGTFVLMER